MALDLLGCVSFADVPVPLRWGRNLLGHPQDGQPVTRTRIAVTVGGRRLGYVAYLAKLTTSRRHQNWVHYLVFRRYPGAHFAVGSASPRRLPRTRRRLRAGQSALGGRVGVRLRRRGDRSPPGEAGSWPTLALAAHLRPLGRPPKVRRKRKGWPSCGTARHLGTATAFSQASHAVHSARPLGCTGPST